MKNQSNGIHQSSRSISSAGREFSALAIGISIFLGAFSALAQPTPAPSTSVPKRPLAPPKTITVLAKDFNAVQSLNVALGGPNGIYGADVLLNAPPYNAAANKAVFQFSATQSGQYRLEVEYAALTPRPVQIKVNGVPALSNALNASTGCWESTCQKQIFQGVVTLTSGRNRLEIESPNVFPHLRKFVFISMGLRDVNDSNNTN